MKRKHSLHVYMSEQEKALLNSLAEKSGLPVSEYVRQAALNNHAPSPDNGLRQVILAQLCELSNLCDLIKDPIVRKQITDWRHDTWQLTK